MGKLHISEKEYYIIMPDRSVWAVPVEVIARDRADHYKEEFDGDIERSLNEDTYPLFENNDYEVADWASNNMNWDDIVGSARWVAEHQSDTNTYKMVDGWCNPEDFEVR